MFEEIKNKVKKIIKDKNIEEINNNTDNKNIGIYMIYIDNSMMIKLYQYTLDKLAMAKIEISKIDIKNIYKKLWH